MKFLTLSKREVRINILPSQYPIKNRENCRSIGQFNVGRILQSIYGINAIILEDFIIPDSKLSLDFYLPHHKIAVEVQGEQHDTYNTFFHNSKEDFKLQQQRDESKKQWCELNQIQLIEIRDTNISKEDFIKYIV